MNTLKLCFCNFERYEVRMLLLKHTATCRHERTRARSDRADKHAQPETQWTPTVEVQRSCCHSHSSFPSIVCPTLRQRIDASFCFALLGSPHSVVCLEWQVHLPVLRQVHQPPQDMVDGRSLQSPQMRLPLVTPMLKELQ